MKRGQQSHVLKRKTSHGLLNLFGILAFSEYVDNCSSLFKTYSKIIVDFYVKYDS